MSLLAEYRQAQGGRRGDSVARLRRVIVLRALSASGMTQRQAADALDISQSAVSRQLRSQPALEGFRADVLLNAAAPVLKFLALERGYERLAVFGTIARANARIDSDIDLVVDAPPGTSSFDFIRFRLMLEEVLGREIDLISYGGLRPTLDDDVRKGAILL